MVPFIRTEPDNFRYGYIPPGEYYKPNFIVNITEYRYMIVMHYRINGIVPYRQFIEEFIHLFDINFGTHHCSYMRLYIHEDGRQSFFLIIRMYNEYINGIHDGLQLYEIGSEPARFFMGCNFTNYGEDYRSLLGTDSLARMKIGPQELQRYAREVQHRQGNLSNLVVAGRRRSFLCGIYGKSLWGP